jgi:MoaA/NifB/PqqE/SkfB family radical SAM enzyme
MECPHRFMERGLAHMDEKIFEAVEQVVSHFESNGGLTTIIPHKDGEPFLCPSFREYFARLTKCTKAKFNVYTNGHLLTPELVEFMSKEIGEGEVWILVSFHHFKYDGTNYGLSKVEQNLKSCLDLQLENVRFVITTHKLDLTDDMWSRDFYAKWMNVKLERPKLYDVHVNTKIDHWAGRIHQRHGAKELIVCPYLDRSHLFVGVTGNVIPCCMDLEEEIIFGNVLVDDLEDIMIKRSAFFDLHDRKEFPHSLCEKCLD